MGARRRAGAARRDASKLDAAPSRRSPSSGPATATPILPSPPHAFAIAAAVSASFLALYVRTLFPDIPGGDATELIFNACQLSVPHPPGYPLFTLIERAFMEAVPVGSPAYRANLAAAFCGALAAGSIALAVLELASGPGRATAGIAAAAAILASGMFGVSRLVWFYAIQAEVFALNNLLCGVTLYLTARFARTRDSGTAVAGALACGLGCANQHTFVFIAAVCIPTVVALGYPRLLAPRTIAALSAAFLLGISPYVSPTRNASDF